MLKAKHREMNIEPSSRKEITHIESNAIIGATDNNLTTTAHTALASNILLPHNQQYNNKETQLCNRTDATQHTTHGKTSFGSVQVDLCRCMLTKARTNNQIL